jgi:hypothetical protein
MRKFQEIGRCEKRYDYYARSSTRKKARSEGAGFSLVNDLYSDPLSQGAVTLVSFWKVNQLFNDVFRGAPK